MIFPCDTVLGKVDTTLEYAKEMVREEGPGILALLLRWRADYRREGLKWTPRMKELRDELVYANDKHRNFANDCAIFDPNAFVQRTRYYERFCAWCKAEKHELMSATEFYRQIAAHPLYKQHGCVLARKRLAPGRANNLDRVIMGVRLKPHEGFENLDECETGHTSTPAPPPVSHTVLPFPDKG
jgi:hypothetical protein